MFDDQNRYQKECPTSRRDDRVGDFVGGMALFGQAVGFDETEVFEDDPRHLSPDSGVFPEKVHLPKLDAPTDTKRPPRGTTVSNSCGEG